MTAVSTDAGLFDGDDAVSRLLRNFDWAAHPLGPVTCWPPVLQVMVRTVLRTAFPMAIDWGPDRITLYNEAYAQLLGGKHPAALGRASRDIWPEAREWSQPRLERVLREGVTLRFDDELQILHRNGYPEECYFTFTHSPIDGTDGRVAGVLTVALETTRQKLAERRGGALRDLRELALATADPPEICRATFEVLETYRASVPFAMSFLMEQDGGLRLHDHYGILRSAAACATGEDASSDVLEHVRRVVESGQPDVITGLRAAAADVLLPGPLGPLLPDTAAVLPLGVGADRVGAVVLGINPYRVLDAALQDFFGLVGQHLQVSLSQAAAERNERHRIEVMADLDRIKTEFFQNVIHELRTPLTLLLAPLQDLLAGAGDPSDPRREDLLAAVRAADRLRSMVDAMLDLSGAESAALQPDLRPNDLVAVTREVASMFRSSAEHGGLRFVVDLPTGPVTAMVDRSMWSTIVTNLLSNAVKYTPVGGIEVRLRVVAGEAVLTVTDTGLGIGTAERERVFDRFHRASPSGPEPGSGIGLAVVTDLVNAHHGRLDLASEPGTGTTFTVGIPLGSPPRSRPVQHRAPVAGHSDARPGLLLVEDDADLRAYLTRLLTADGWRVQAAADAETAVAAALAPTSSFDLVLTDVILPGHSGLELIGQLRSAPGTSRLPIIVLTGRGGPDSMDQALAAGADDYLTKPFSSRELLARVRSSAELQRSRERAVSEAETRVDEVRHGLESNRAIGTAVGILMATYHLTADQAFRLLATTSQNLNLKLRDVAAGVVDAGALPFRPTVVDDLLLRTMRTSSAGSRSE